MDDRQGIRPPPYYHPSQRKSRNSCLRCIGCCCCFLITLAILLVVAAVIIKIKLKPQTPSLQLDRLDVKSFSLVDATISSDLQVSVKSENPNKLWGIVYEKGINVAIEYKGTTLCSGKSDHPLFVQKPQSEEIIRVDVKGKTSLGKDIKESLFKDKQAGKVPLLLKTETNALANLFKFLPFKKIQIAVNSSLVVGDLLPNRRAEVKSSKQDIFSRQTNLWGK